MYDFKDLVNGNKVDNDKFEEQTAKIYIEL